MEDVCLYDFVAEYKKSGVDDDGNPGYSMLTKPILPNQMFDPSKENKRENYFYSLLLLFVPIMQRGSH